MSDWYEAVAVENVPVDRAEALAQRVVVCLAGEGIIQSSFDPESVLGGEGGYRPGPRIAEVYRRCDSEADSRALLTNGMEPCVGRWINEHGFAGFDGFTCIECNRKFAPDDESVAGPFAKAIGEFFKGVDDPPVSCPGCGVASSVRRWKTDPHGGFVNLAFQFWNWPPFSFDSWTVDIPAMISEATGHEVITTYGRL